MSPECRLCCNVPSVVCPSVVCPFTTWAASRWVDDELNGYTVEEGAVGGVTFSMKDGRSGCMQQCIYCRGGESIRYIQGYIWDLLYLFYISLGEIILYYIYI